MRVWFSGRTRPCQGRDAVSITATRTKYTEFLSVLPAGIEPTSTVPKTGTLSIELRELLLHITSKRY